MSLLTEQEIENIFDNARRSLRRYQSGIRGQQVTPLDDPDYHLILATEAAVIQKIKAQGPVGYGLFVDGKRVSIGQYRSSMSIGKKQVRSQPLYRLPEGDEK